MINTQHIENLNQCVNFDKVYEKCRKSKKSTNAHELYLQDYGTETRTLFELTKYHAMSQINHKNHISVSNKPSIE